MNSITLNNGNQIPQMMFGSFQMNEQADMDAVVKRLLTTACWGFDTSPSYRTEEMLSAAVRGLIAKREGLSRSDFFLDTKIDEWQMIAKKGGDPPFRGKNVWKNKSGLLGPYPDPLASAGLLYKNVACDGEAV